jgi:hypothetical protein
MSSEFHAWGDSNLYLRRSGGELTLTVEHRAAPSPPMIGLALAQRGDALALEIASSIAAPAAAPTSIDERITAAISEANRPLPIRELRALCRVRNGTLYERLTALTDTGKIVRGPEGYRLATNLDPTVIVPSSASRSLLQRAGSGTGIEPRIA